SSRPPVDGRTNDLLCEARAESAQITQAALVNPYPGLIPFAERDARRFFGRDREVDEVLERLATRRFLAVIGVSGCGKSSLVRAGVIPVLRMGVTENLPARFHVCTLQGTHPLERLRWR